MVYDKGIDSYTSENVFGSLCELRANLVNESEAIQIMKGSGLGLQLRVDVEEHYQSSDSLTSLLKPIIEEGGCEEMSSVCSFRQDSVCRLLLRVECMQNCMLSFLLSKVVGIEWFDS